MQVPQKIYCYVDESGQDDASSVFVVVAVVSDHDQVRLRLALVDIEKRTGIFHFKWHKSGQRRRVSYLRDVLASGIAASHIFVGQHNKPTPYFPALLDTVVGAITAVAKKRYHAIVIVDGVDKKKAAECTRELRSRGISLEHVRSAKDESEPIIRLADRWAGCVRAALLGNVEAKALFESAIAKRHIRIITK